MNGARQFTVISYFGMSIQYLSCKRIAYSLVQPVYNTIVGVQDNFHVSYSIRVITRVNI